VKKELEQAQTDNAHLHSQMASMAEELGQKSEEVRKYHAEQQWFSPGFERLSAIRVKSRTKPSCTISWWKPEIQLPRNRPFPSS
jgi:hypothetical protein